jgi:hypothetical protein
MCRRDRLGRTSFTSSYMSPLDNQDVTDFLAEAPRNVAEMSLLLTANCRRDEGCPGERMYVDSSSGRPLDTLCLLKLLACIPFSALASLVSSLVSLFAPAEVAEAASE